MTSVCFRLSNLEGLEKAGIYVNDLNMFEAKKFRGLGESGDHISMISMCLTLSNLEGLKKVGLYINGLNMF